MRHLAPTTRPKATRTLLPTSATLALRALTLTIVLLASNAYAAGSFKLKSTEAQEVSGAWHVFVTIDLPKPPPIAHVPMKFLFTKTAAYERSLVDNNKEPVLNRMVLSGQNPSVESLDVDFADASGKIFKTTRFDFGLTRTRGYEAGEYKVQVRTSDGLEIGGTQTLVLKGDNPVVDRRSMTFNAKEPRIKKVDDGVPGGAKPAQEEVASASSPDVAPVGTAAPFVAPEAYQKTSEEEIKERPKGCGCDVPGRGVRRGFGAGVALALGMAMVSRRRTRHKA